MLNVKQGRSCESRASAENFSGGLNGKKRPKNSIIKSLLLIYQIPSIKIQGVATALPAPAADVHAVNTNFKKFFGLTRLGNRTQVYRILLFAQSNYCSKDIKHTFQLKT